MQEEYDEDVLDASVLTEVLPIFQKLSQEGRERLIQTVATFFGIRTNPPGLLTHNEHSVSEPKPSGQMHFSTDRSLTPKEFVVQKQPRTDIERVACLAYYLTHYRDLPHFKTIDLSKLNTEAAQPKFANAAWSVNNATKQGYLVPATKANKQISAAGEQFVQALPDRESARAALANARPRRKKKLTLKRGAEATR